MNIKNVLAILILCVGGSLLQAETIKVVDYRGGGKGTEKTLALSNVSTPHAIKNEVAQVYGVSIRDVKLFDIDGNVVRQGNQFELSNVHATIGKVPHQRLNSRIYSGKAS